MSFIAQPTLKPSNAQRASKSKCSSGFKKPIVVVAISPKKDVECSHPKNDVAVISNEARQMDLLYNGTRDASTVTTKNLGL